MQHARNNPELYTSHREARVFSQEQERIIAWHEKICELAKCDGPDHGDHMEAQDKLIDIERSLKNSAAVALGSIRSEKKAKAARENGKKGGRPKKEPKEVTHTPEKV